MEEGVNECKVLVEFISSLNPEHSSLKEFNELIDLITEKVSNFLLSLQEIASEDNKSTLTKRIASESKERLMHL
jgi:hypothetical protein